MSSAPIDFRSDRRPRRKFRSAYVLPGAFCALVALATPLHALAAGNTLIPPDGNSLVVVENAVIRGNETTLLFWTHPDRGDPAAGKPCALNVYSVTLRPGLGAARAAVVAKGACGTGLSKARLLDDGDALVLAPGRLERWRKGEKIATLGVGASHGVQWHDISSTGDVVVAMPPASARRGARQDTAMTVSSLGRDGKERWQLRLAEPGRRVSVHNLWAAPGGAALLHLGSMADDGSSLAMQSQLHFIDAKGEQRLPLQLTRSDQPDLRTLMALGKADVREALARIGQSKPESIEKIDAAARTDGGFDVLLQRKGAGEGREGHFLLHIGADGGLRSERAVSASIVPYGLEHWVDFYRDGEQLVLLSGVLATQPAVRARRKAYPQNAISTIDLESGRQLSRLVPLDSRYLEAAMNAGDADVQHLPDRPGGAAVLLTRLGGVPLAVSRGYLSRRQALRLDEGTEDLPVYDEAFRQRQADAAKEAGSKQRKADRTARQERFNADLAASVGMTPEAFAALSNRERKEAMLRRGDLDAMRAAGMKQATAANGMAARTDMAAVADADAFSMPVKDVFAIGGGDLVLTGIVESGRVAVGDSICLVSAKSGKRTLKVKGVALRGAEVPAAGKREPAGVRVAGISKRDAKKGDELRGSCGPD